MQIMTAIVTFFSQFFQPTKKNLMGMITKAIIRKPNTEAKKGGEERHEMSLDSLIISLL